MKNYLLWGLTATAILGSQNAQAMNFVIDDFAAIAPGSYQNVFVGEIDDEEQLPFSEEPNGATVPGVPPVGGSPLLGNYRDLFLSNVTGDVFGESASAVIGNNKVYYNNEDSISSVLTIQWDGQDGSENLSLDGLGGIDITNGGTLDVLSLGIPTLDSPLSVIMDIYDMNGNHAQAAYIFSIAADNQMLYLAMTANAYNNLATTTHKTLFQPTELVDFKNIGSIQLILQGLDANQPALNAQLGMLQAMKVPNPIPRVPEPTISFLSLLCASLLGSFVKQK